MDNIKKIKSLSSSAMAEASQYIDNLAKPIGSLGKLEQYAIKLAGIRGYMGCPFRKGGILVFAADNGVHAEGITPVPQSVTAQQAVNIAEGVSGVSVFAAQEKSDVFVYNVGIKDDITSDKITDIRIMRGTENIAEGPAMTREQCLKAFQKGFDAATEHTDCDVLGIGEMGICNTTTAAAVLSVLAELPIREVTGRGAGCTDEQYEKKINVIRKAIEIDKPDKKDVFDVIAKVGGLDIAAMTGAYIGAAYSATPVVIDGFISAVAALCACRLNEIAADYMFASHQSEEPGFKKAISLMGLEPALNLNMRLGEGSGCPLMFHILNASLLMVDNMAKLDSAGITTDNLVKIK